MKNSFRNALYNAGGFIIPGAVALLTTPYIVYKLTPEVYGIYILAISLIGVMSFLDLGLGQGVIKFVSTYAAKNNYRRINEIISMSILIYLIMGIIGFFSIFLLSNWLTKDIFKVSPVHIHMASLAIKIVAIGFVVNFVNGVLSNIPKALQRYDIQVKVQSSIFICSNISAVVFLYFGKGLIAVLCTYITFQLVSVFIYILVSKQILPTLRFVPFFRKDVFKEISSFSVFIAVNNITGNIVFRADKIIIALFLGTEAVTYYQIPLMVVQMAYGFINSVSQFLFPAVSYAHSLYNKEWLVRAYVKSTRYVHVATLVITTGLLLLGNSFISLWMGAAFAKKVAFAIPIISLVYLFQAISVVGYWFYNGLGKAWVNTVASLIGASSYLMSIFILIPKLKLFGAVIALAFTVVPFPLYIYLLHRMIGVSNKWFFSALIKLLIAVGFMYAVKYFVLIPNNAISIIASGIVSVVFSMAMALLMKIISLEDIREINNKLIRVALRI